MCNSLACLQAPWEQGPHCVSCALQRSRTRAMRWPSWRAAAPPACAIHGHQGTYIRHMRAHVAALLAAPVLLPVGAAAYYYQNTIGPAVRDIGVPSTTILGAHQAQHPLLHGTCFLASIPLPEALKDTPNDQIFAAFKQALDFPHTQLPRKAWCWLPADRTSIADHGQPSMHTHASATASDPAGPSIGPSAYVPEEMLVWSTGEHHGAVWASVKDGFKTGERTHLHFVMGSIKSTAIDEFTFPGGYLLKALHHAYKRYLVFDARARAVSALSEQARAEPVQCKLKE